METVFIGFSIIVWTYAGDPDDDVHSAGGFYADIGQVFWNTSSQKLFLCNASSGPNTQTWIPYMGGVPAQIQSDWTQASSGALDFIKHKPSLATVATTGAYSDLTGKPSLATVATSGSYTDLSSKPTIPAAQIQSDWTQASTGALDYIKNKPVAALARSQSNASRTLNSGFQISTTRDCFANYSVDIATSLTLTTGQAGTVYLEIASDSGFTTNLQELARFVNGNTGTLTIGLALSQNVTGTLSGYVPAGYYARLRTQNNTSTPTFTYRSGQEVLA